MKCTECGGEFRQNRSWQHFCSQRCRNNHTDPVSDIARRAWRLQTALAFLPKQWSVPVGAALWWMVGATHRDVGCSIWVGWLGEQSRPRWHQGFEGVRFNLEGIYQVAQQKGWRYPLAHNLNRLHEMTIRAEASQRRYFTKPGPRSKKS